MSGYADKTPKNSVSTKFNPNDKHLRLIEDIECSKEDLANHIAVNQDERELMAIKVDVNPRINPRDEKSALLSVKDLEQLQERVRKILASQSGLRVAIPDTDTNHAFLEDSLNEVADGKEDSVKLLFALPGAQKRVDTATKSTREREDSAGSRSLSAVGEAEITKVLKDYQPKLDIAMQALEQAAEKSFNEHELQGGKRTPG